MLNQNCAACGQPLSERSPNVATKGTTKATGKTGDKKSAKGSSLKNDTAEQPAKSNTSSPKGRKSSTKDKTSAPSAPDASDLADIHLEGEDTESVPIYASCDDIRKLVNAHLPQTSKAAFSRQLTEMLPSSKVTSKNMDQLLKMKGPRAGAHNPAFYASYVFFEKLRVKEGKKKSAKRLKMEDMWKEEGGIPRVGSHELGLMCMGGERPVMDQYGQISIKGEPKSGSIQRKMLK